MDPVSGNERPGPTTDEQVRARLSQTAVVNVTGQSELLAMQKTVVSLWDLLVNRGTTLTSDSVITDENGQKYAVVGSVADRPFKHPKFRAASLRLVSDMQ